MFCESLQETLFGCGMTAFTVHVLEIKLVALNMHCEVCKKGDDDIEFETNEDYLRDWVACDWLLKDFRVPKSELDILSFVRVDSAKFNWATSYRYLALQGKLGHMSREEMWNNIMKIEGEIFYDMTMSK
jgi:hypothetical protein